MRTLPTSLLSLAVATVAPLLGQCATQPLSLAGVPGASFGISTAVVWDPDGSGPLPAVPVIAGGFTGAGSVVANGIAWYDAAANDWRAFGSGFSAGGGAGAAGWFLGGASALLPLPNGDLVAGGAFTSAGGVPASRVAVWSNGAWSPLGSGMNGDVWSLARLATGEIVAGGAFTAAGGAPANNLAIWNGNTWAAFGGGRPSSVSVLAVLANGDVAAGGSGGGWIWNGSWASLTNQPVYAMSAAPGGGVIWSSRYYTWSPSPPPFGSTVEVPFIAETVAATTTYLLTGTATRGLGWLPNGDLIAGWGNAVQRWNGAVWSPFAPGVYGTVLSLVPMPNGEVVAAGTIEAAGGLTVESVAAWDGLAWRRLGNGFDGAAMAIAERPAGELVVGGNFNLAGQTGAKIAQWNGSQWSLLGGSVLTPFGSFLTVSRLVTLPGGDLVATGSFASVGGVAAANIARWNGAAWSPLGAGANGRVDAAIVRADGRLVIGGSFSTPGDDIATWDGTSWSSFGLGSNGNVYALVEMPGGDLVAAGYFSAIGGVPANNIARWTDAGWQPLGSGVNHVVHSVVCLPNGDLVAGGWFTVAGGAAANFIARWNGTAWVPMGPGFNSLVTDLFVLPNGDLVASGAFTSAGGVPVERLARWNGTAWGPVAGTGGAIGFDDMGYAMQLLSTGEIAVAGRFTAVGGITAASVALLSPTCPASSVTFGAGCVGGGGMHQLSHRSLPWIGGTFRARASGLAPISLAVSVLGFAPAATPLSAVLPQGLPGCMLLATPDLLDVQIPVAGIVTTAASIPNTGALVGAMLFHQVVAIELDTAANIVALAGTNGLVLTIGAL
jgi:trimeric autotransporter adhesin